MKYIKLCCGRPAACPELHKASDGSISITDDYGGIVTLKRGQFEKLLEEGKKL